MYYFKNLLISLFYISIFMLPVQAENWINADNNGQTILLDSDSIKYNNDSLYYNVRYYETKINEDLIVTIQSKNNNAGIVSTCKFSNYQKNKNLANTNTSKQAKSMKALNSNSLLYNADILAKSLNKDETTNNNDSDTETINDIDFGPYLRDLQRRIKMNWDPPKWNNSTRVILIFKIAKDGRLLSCSVLKSSGVPGIDKAALEAVKATEPFKPLPAKFKGKSVNIEFSFDYNVFGKSRY